MFQISLAIARGVSFYRRHNDGGEVARNEQRNVDVQNVYVASQHENILIEVERAQAIII
jgi:hypothetical protein